MNPEVNFQRRRIPQYFHKSRHETAYGVAIHRDSMYVTDTGVHAVFQFKIEADMRLVAKEGVGDLVWDSSIALADSPSLPTEMYS